MLILIYKLFLFKAKDLANRRTDMVLLYSEANYRSREGFRLFSALLYSFDIEPLAIKIVLKVQ